MKSKVQEGQILCLDSNIKEYLIVVLSDANVNNTVRQRIKRRIANLEQQLRRFSKLNEDAQILYSELEIMKRNLFLFLIEFYSLLVSYVDVSDDLVLDYFSNYDFVDFYSNNEIVQFSKHVWKRYLLKRNVTSDFILPSERTRISRARVDFYRNLDSYMRLKKRMLCCVVRINHLVRCLELDYEKMEDKYVK